MNIYLAPDQRPKTETAIAIGSFDGVHLGHQALLEELKRKASEYRVPSVVYTFDPPTKVLTCGVEFLSSLPEKVELLAQRGIDEVVAVPFTPEFAAKHKTEFLADLKLLRPRAVVIGQDFYFGKGRAGNAQDLLGICEDVLSVPLQRQGGEDIKSTRVRDCLRAGDVAAAARLLGRPYAARGVVVAGDRLGRTIGYPTANVEVPAGKALPSGIYAVYLSAARQRRIGMAYIGTRPAVGGKERRFEVNIFDFSDDLYGQEVQVEFMAYLRGDQPFAGLEALQTQLAHDEMMARAALGGP